MPLLLDEKLQLVDQYLHNLQEPLVNSGDLEFH
jgi:hypothetical protein